MAGPGPGHRLPRQALLFKTNKLTARSLRPESEALEAPQRDRLTRVRRNGSAPRLILCWELETRGWGVGDLEVGTWGDTEGVPRERRLATHVQ